MWTFVQDDSLACSSYTVEDITAAEEHVTLLSERCTWKDDTNWSKISHTCCVNVTEPQMLVSSNVRSAISLATMLNFKLFFPFFFVCF